MSKKYLFENIKNGDLLGFHFKSFGYIIGYFIGKITGKTGNNLKIPGLGHIGIVLNVERKNNLVCFTFCEYTFSHGKMQKQYFMINKNSDILIDSFFKRKKVDLFFTEINQELSKKENELANTYWKIDEKYNIIEAAISPNWAERILKFFGYKKNINNNNFCSGGVYDCLKLAGRKFKNENENKSPTPIELINDPIFIKTTKIFL